MSDADSPEDKKTDKPLTASQQLRNLLSSLLDEEGCPPEDRMTTKQRAGLEEMSQAVDHGRVEEAQAKDFLERLRESLAEPEPMSKEDAESVKERLLEKLRSWERTEADRKTQSKSRYIN